VIISTVLLVSCLFAEKTDRSTNYALQRTAVIIWCPRITTILYILTSL